jgi:hypothetical protein
MTPIFVIKVNTPIQHTLISFNFKVLKGTLLHRKLVGSAIV